MKHNTFARPNISRVKEEEDTQQRQIIGRVAEKRKEKEEKKHLLAIGHPTLSSVATQYFPLGRSNDDNVWAGICYATVQRVPRQTMRVGTVFQLPVVKPIQMTTK